MIHNEYYKVIDMDNVLSLFFYFIWDLKTNYGVIFKYYKSEL